MLAVDKSHRRKGIGNLIKISFNRSFVFLLIGSSLVRQTIQRMMVDECDEVVLETEVTNGAALSLYENLGFVRDKYLHQYYLNGEDAYRLKLWLKKETFIE